MSSSPQFLRERPGYKYSEKSQYFIVGFLSKNSSDAEIRLSEDTTPPQKLYND